MVQLVVGKQHAMVSAATKLLAVPVLNPKRPATDDGEALSSRCCFSLYTFIPVEGL